MGSDVDFGSVVRGLMDNGPDKGLWGALGDLVKFASVNDNKHDDVKNCRDAIINKFTMPGIHVDRWPEKPFIHNGHQLTPLVYAKSNPVIEDAPTVLIYSHYDVQPAPEKDWEKKGWKHYPFKPDADEPDLENKDTRKYGRGAADDKSGIIMHLGVVRAFSDSSGLHLPVNLKLIFEGEEETSFGALEAYLEDSSTDKEPFKANLIVIADCGNTVLGQPTLTTTLRGCAVFTIEVHTLDAEVHSGMYGGPAPDAFMALVRLLATLHKDNGDVAIELHRDDNYHFAEVDKDQFRVNAGVLPGIPLIGTGSLAQRLGGRPSINVVGLDGVNPIDKANNVLCPKATAQVSVRLAPNQDLTKVRQAIQDHLDKFRPWGIKPTVTFKDPVAGFEANTNGKYFKAASEALSKAYNGKKTVWTGAGGSIPLVNLIDKINNHKADIVLWGCEEPRCHIHGINESVSKNELTNMTIAEALLLQDISKPRP